MIGSKQNLRSRRNCCTPAALPWTLVAILSVISLGSLYQLQLVMRDASRAQVKLKTMERLQESESNLFRTKLAQTDIKVAGFLQERDKLLADQKGAMDKLKQLEARNRNATEAMNALQAEASAARERLKAAEEEIKEITVKAGSCREQYNSLNADCATMKQGLANLGLNSQTVVEENKDNSLSGSEAAGALDPRGGMEAALVLKENSQQPWKTYDDRVKAAGVETEDKADTLPDLAEKENPAFKNPEKRPAKRSQTRSLLLQHD